MILSHCKAKKFHSRQSIKNALRNMCCRLNLAEADYFESDVLLQDLVMIKLPWGRTYVLFGSQLRASLTPEEQNELLWLGLQQVQSQQLQALTLMTLLSYPFYAPLLWLEKFPVLSTFKLFISFMLYPYFILRDFLVGGQLESAVKKHMSSSMEDKRLLLSVVTKKKAFDEHNHLLKNLLSPNIVEGERFIRDDVEKNLTSQASVA